MTTTSLTLREVRTPDDFAAIAAVLSAADPDWPATPELLQAEDEARDRQLYFTQRVAEQEGRVVGVMHAGHDDFAFEPHRYSGKIVVHPDARRQGVGSALYAEALRVLQAREQQEQLGRLVLRTMLPDSEQTGIHFLKARGFEGVWQRYDLRLHTARVDYGTLDALEPRLQQAGVRLVSLASLAGEPERDRWLWALDWQLFQDVPMGQTLTQRPLEAWVQQELLDPMFRPELSFVALRDGLDDPESGPFIGYTTLMQSPGGFYMIGMTGVRRQDRGLGVARALKLASMRALQQQGGGEIRTYNDAPNVAMRRMNEQLGFELAVIRRRYELTLQTGAVQP
ncbi:GNAT family N-acetyltransferase [Deinococcus sonorensis]|uniref:GNAT family N-acetyltransferase n=2 Tax=Deinococcus sonorensis TaxID=309891 RepID=A0AAU7UCJ9_9DEIO